MRCFSEKKGRVCLREKRVSSERRGEGSAREEHRQVFDFQVFGPADDVDRSIDADGVVDVLERLALTHGAPHYVRFDNGPEFVAAAILRWLTDAGIDTALIDPGKPWQNATDESFNGKFRDECLTLHWFRHRLDAKVGIEQWRRHYNEVRPHSSLGYLTPHEFKAILTTTTEEGRSAAAPPRAESEEPRAKDHNVLTNQAGGILQ